MSLFGKQATDTQRGKQISQGRTVSVESQLKPQLEPMFSDSDLPVISLAIVWFKANLETRPLFCFQSS